MLKDKRSLCFSHHLKDLTYVKSLEVIWVLQKAWIHMYPIKYVDLITCITFTANYLKMYNRATTGGNREVIQSRTSQGSGSLQDRNVIFHQRKEAFNLKMSSKFVIFVTLGFCMQGLPVSIFQGQCGSREYPNFNIFANEFCRVQAKHPICALNINEEIWRENLQQWGQSRPSLRWTRITTNNIHPFLPSPLNTCKKCTCRRCTESQKVSTSS